MININNYIAEKLHLNKDTKIKGPMIQDYCLCYASGDRYKYLSNKYVLFDCYDGIWQYCFFIPKSDLSKLDKELRNVAGISTMYEIPKEYTDVEKLKLDLRQSIIKKKDLISLND